MSTEAPTKSQILDDVQVRQKIRRIAFQIYENNFKEKNIVLAGIEGQGFVLTQLISKELASISSVPQQVIKVSLDKLAPQQSEVEIDCDEKDIRKKCIVLVDDVLNTGRTLAFGMKPFLSVEVKKIEVAVLVNRSHSKFPIQPTYTGFELSTTLSDHVEVVLSKKSAIYLL